MAITGKQFTAVITKTPYGSGAQKTLLYAQGITTPDEIRSYYPGLTWDFELATNISQINQFYLGQYDPDNPAWPSLEAAMLDTDWYRTTGSILALAFTAAIRYTSGLWKQPGEGYWGSPADLWQRFDGPIYAETVPTPFGDYGNGTIRHEALSWYPGHETDPDEDRSVAVQSMYPDPPGVPDTGRVVIGVCAVTYIFTPLYSGSGGGGGGGGDEDAIDLSQSPTIRVWGYSLDGHDFYVLRLGASETLVYDLTTSQWSQWASPARSNWRAHCGQNWLGMSTNTFSRGFGSDVVAGDDATGILWVLDPATGVDDNTDTGTTGFVRMVIGGVPLNGRDVAPCNAAQLTASLGNLAMTGATITATLRTSDDGGNGYINHGTVTLTNSRSQVVEWRALGQMKQPGRVFEISDTGITRLSGLDLR